MEMIKKMFVIFGVVVISLIVVCLLNFIVYRIMGFDLDNTEEIFIALGIWNFIIACVSLTIYIGTLMGYF